MKIFEKVPNRGVQSPKKELIKTIDQAKKTHDRRYRSAAKASLRDRYRRKKKASIEISCASMPDSYRTVIMASILAQGSVITRYNTCGTKGCHCAKGGKKHGPYNYLALPMPASMVRRGTVRTRHYYITPEEADELREKIGNFKRIQEKVWLELYDDFENGTVIDDLIQKRE